jgi:hypothetical protein
VLDPLAAQIVADADRRVRAAAQRHAERRPAAVRVRPAGAAAVARPTVASVAGSGHRQVCEPGCGTGPEPGYGRELGGGPGDGRGPERGFGPAVPIGGEAGPGWPVRRRTAGR